MKSLPKLLLSLLLFAAPSFAWSVEFDIQAEKVWWQYQEYAKNEPVISTSLPSKSKGQGAKIELGLNMEWRSDWLIGLSASYMDSISQATERWGVVQTNNIKMKETTLRLDVSSEIMRHARLGFWLAGRKQNQSREKFILNGVATALAREPIIESITSSWIGLSFVGTGGGQQQLQVGIDVAIPLYVNVTNPLFTQDFTKKNGYRAGINFQWQLPEEEVILTGLNVTLSYNYQELGGDLQASGDFWPYNRWQTLGLGMLYAW